MRFVPESVTRSVGRQLLKTQKNSPHILFAAGLVGIASSVVLACRATLKLEKAADEIKTDLQAVKILGEDAKTNNVNYSRQDYGRDMLYVYGKSAIKVTKLYGPSVVVGTVGVVLLTGSHVQLSRRNQGLTIALAAVSKAFEEYRVRVQDEIGMDRELNIYRGIREEKIEGQKELVAVTGLKDGPSPYSRVFDAENVNFKKSAEYNRLFVQTQEAYANHLLNARGHVFLNDVYDQLGFDRTSIGAIVGWVRNGEGDGYINFGLYEAVNTQPVHAFDLSAIILDFNVDGIVYDLIEEQK
jgi:Family of unknown function (DUF6353)